MQRLLKRWVLWFVLVQALALVLLGALHLGRRGVGRDASGALRRRLQQWQQVPCASGYHSCWSLEPRPSQSSGWNWYPDEDDEWEHYDDVYHDDGHDDDVKDDDGYHDDYYYDDENWHDDYYHTAPVDDDYVYHYEAVPDASIIHTPNGGYGGRRGRSLSQIRFNKCPPVIDGYESSQWIYAQSRFSETNEASAMQIVRGTSDPT